jgi:hypothetical protein
MPETEQNSNERVRAAEPVRDEVVQPASSEERLKAKLAALEAESDDDRGPRRAAELKQQTNIHLANIGVTNEMYPVRNASFSELSADEQETWNKRRASIDQANRAYHLAVQRVIVEHRQEDQHLAKLRSEAAAKNA